MAVKSAYQSSPSHSGRFHRRPRPPPGRSTRWISASAASASNQWNAAATKTGSTLPPASGISSALPGRTSASGSRSESTRRISAIGSTAITRPASGTSAAVSLPVPAARSSTVDAGMTPSSPASQASASGGYGGRPRSYASATRPNEAACRSSCGSGIHTYLAGRGEAGLGGPRRHRYTACEMRRMLVLGGFLALAAAAAASVFLAVSRGSGEPTAASAATKKPRLDRVVSASYRHHHGHTRAPVRRFGYPRMHFHKVREGSHGKNVLRLQQLLARRGYLPVTFLAFGAQPMYTLAPRQGRFQWRFEAPPELRSQWQPGVFSTITRGAVMSFQADHGLPIDGIAGSRVWQALTGPKPFTKVPYTYALVREASPETITVYQTGHANFTSLANTGIPEAPTALGA